MRRETIVAVLVAGLLALVVPAEDTYGQARTPVGSGSGTQTPRKAWGCEGTTGAVACLECCLDMGQSIQAACSNGGYNQEFCEELAEETFEECADHSACW